MRIHELNTQHSLPAQPGTVDIAIRYNTLDSSYSYCVEENGLPTSVPVHVFNGILQTMIANMTQYEIPKEEDK